MVTRENAARFARSVDSVSAPESVVLGDRGQWEVGLVGTDVSGVSIRMDDAHPVERDGRRTSREVVEVLAVHHALCRALHVVKTHNRVEVDLAHRLLGHGASRAPIRCAKRHARIDMLVQKQVFEFAQANSLQFRHF